jgi:hypothetical protein
MGLIHLCRVTFVKDIKPNIEISSLARAKALNALKVSSVIESPQYFNVPMEQLRQLLQHYPRVGKHFPLTPSFPRLSNVSSITEADANLRLGMEILTFSVPGMDYALRCPDSKVSRIFTFFQLLGL